MDTHQYESQKGLLPVLVLLFEVRTTRGGNENVRQHDNRNNKSQILVF